MRLVRHKMQHSGAVLMQFSCAMMSAEMMQSAATPVRSRMRLVSCIMQLVCSCWTRSLQETSVLVGSDTYSRIVLSMNCVCACTRILVVFERISLWLAEVGCDESVLWLHGFNSRHSRLRIQRTVGDKRIANKKRHLCYQTWIFLRCGTSHHGCNRAKHAFPAPAMRNFSSSPRLPPKNSARS